MWLFKSPRVMAEIVMSKEIVSSAKISTNVIAGRWRREWEERVVTDVIVRII